MGTKVDIEEMGRKGGKARAALDQRVRLALEEYFRARAKKTPISPHDIAVTFIDGDPDLIRQWNTAQVETMVRLSLP
jgi:hypothetical protein